MQRRRALHNLSWHPSRAESLNRGLFTGRDARATKIEIAPHFHFSLGIGRLCHWNRKEREPKDFRDCATARVAPHLSLRAPSARVDLPSDKGRLYR
jgi:hypothetical protein